MNHKKELLRSLWVGRDQSQQDTIYNQIWLETAAAERLDFRALGLGLGLRV